MSTWIYLLGGPDAYHDYRMDYAGSKINVSDVDEASSHLHELYLHTDPQVPVQLQPIAASRILQLADNEKPTLADLYDIILQHWIGPLPLNVAVRVRQQKERLARRVAAEVLLASARVRHNDSETSSAQQVGFGQDSSHSMPILPSKPMEGASDVMAAWTSSQPLSTLPHSSMQFSMPSSSQSIPTFAPSAPSDSLSRLSKHLQIRGASTTPTIIPSNVSRVLEHWQVGIDPHVYDWVAAEDILRPSLSEEISQEQREKERKKRERRDRRQQREDELMRVKTSSQPMVFPRSSPGPELGGMGSSSQIPSQAHSQVPLPRHGLRAPRGTDLLIPQSQVEPGRFGGRPDKKKKKKGRVSGF